MCVCIKISVCVHMYVYNKWNWMTVEAGILLCVNWHGQSGGTVRVQAQGAKHRRVDV